MKGRKESVFALRGFGVTWDGVTWDAVSQEDVKDMKKSDEGCGEDVLAPRCVSATLRE